MKQLSIISIIYCLLIVPSLAQSTRKINNPVRLVIDSSKATSQMEIDYSSAAIFKTVSKRKEYRIGDLISIDLGILNKTQKPIYFLDLYKFAKINVQDADGNEVIAGRLPVRYSISFEDFSLVDTGDYYSTSILYSLGDCENQKKYKVYNSETEKFNDNYFVNEDRGCINIKKSGNYSIKTSIENTYVLNDITKKTAIGKMESAPLKVTVIE